MANLGFADDIRQHGLHRLLDGAAVVVRHPCAEFQQQRTEDRLGADDRADELHAGHVGLVEQLDHRGQCGARPHRHAHPGAGLQGARDRLGKLVIKGFPGGVIDQHAGVFRHGAEDAAGAIIVEVFQLRGLNPRT